MLRSARVAIIGNGIAASASAIALARAGVDGVMMIAPLLRPSGFPIGESLPPDVRPLMGQLGMLQPFLDDGHAPCLGSRAAWGSPDCGHNDFLLHPLAHGWHLDRARFDALFRATAVHTAAAFTGRLVGAVEDADGVTLTVRQAGGDEAVTRVGYAVDATGTGAGLARRLGIVRKVHDRMLFVYGWFQGRGGHGDSLTLAETTPDGWWYAAGLPQGRIAVAFATEAKLALTLGWRDESRWLRGLSATRHLVPRLAGSHLIPGSFRVVAASVARLAQVQGRRWLAVGDAAASHDPVSADGITKALEDSLTAAAAIAAAGTGPLDGAHGTAVAARFADHLALRHWLYGLERRWPAATFWVDRIDQSHPRAA